MNPVDARLLRRWLALIDRLRVRGVLTVEAADAIRAESLEAIT